MSDAELLQHRIKQATKARDAARAEYVELVKLIPIVNAQMASLQALVDDLQQRKCMTTSALDVVEKALEFLSDGEEWRGGGE